MATTNDSRRFPLIRPQAIAGQSAKTYGVQLAMSWPGIRYAYAAAAACAAVVFAFAWFVDYTPSYQAPCRTFNGTADVDLRSPRAGTVAAIAVVPGQFVKAGTRLGTTFHGGVAGESPGSGDALAGARARQRVRHTEHLQSAATAAAGEVDVLEAHARTLEDELPHLQTTLRLQQQALAITRSQEHDSRELAAQGFLSAAALAQKRQEGLAMEGNVEAALLAIQRNRRDLDEVHAQMRLAHDRQRLNLADIDDSDGNRELDRDESGVYQTYLAPLDGVVDTGTLAIGQSVAEGTRLFSIVPTGRALAVRIVVPPRARQALAVGTDVDIVVSGYPMDRYGALPARITAISPSSVAPADLPYGLGAAESSFVATAQVASPARFTSGQAVDLQPGMSGTALLHLRKRRLIWWFIPHATALDDPS